MEYQPGVCNIGPTQQRRRLLLGVASLVAAAAYVAAVVSLAWPRWALILSVFPLYGAAMGALQYRERFCIGFAGMGVFDVGEGTNEIRDEEALAADRKKAVRLNAKAMAIGAVGTIVVFAAVTVFASSAAAVPGGRFSPVNPDRRRWCRDHHERAYRKAFKPGR